MVLAVVTPEVTPCTGDGETLRARMEMVERLLLHGVYSQSAWTAIDITHEVSTDVASAMATPRLPLQDMAVVRTEPTLHSAIIYSFVIPTLHHFYY